MYTLTNRMPDGTSMQMYIPASFAQLVAAFGPPNSTTDGFKVSTEWAFEGPDGKLVTLYDWKATDLYDDENPTVEEFRAQPSYAWHIGAHSELQADQFFRWIERTLIG